MDMRAAFFSIAVADYQSTRAWYERLMGRQADMTPNENEVCWQLSETAWFYVINNSERAGKALLTLIIDDLDDQISELEQRGLTVDSTELTDYYRKANFVDPEGNTISFSELARE